MKLLFVIILGSRADMGKKVLYLMRYRDMNLRNKIDGQMKSLRDMGYVVYFLILKNGYIFLTDNESEVPIKHVLFSENPLYHHTKWYIDMVLSTIRVITKEKFDFCYVRSFPLGFFRWLLYRHININRIPLIVEIPTYIMKKRETQDKALYNYASRYISLWDRISAKYVTLFALIGDKINGFYFERPAINIQNATDIDSFRPVKLDYEERCINLVGVGSLANWHGYDRLIRGLADYQGADYEIVFHIIGDGTMYVPWKKLAEDLNVGEKVKFHGVLYGEELNTFLDRCDLGISSLGLYRNDIIKANTLKSKEYMAQGLPFIYAGEDQSIEKNFKYCYQVPNDSTKIDVESIIKYAILMRKEQNVQEIMRCYAVKFLSWKTQWNIIIEALEKWKRSGNSILPIC